MANPTTDRQPTVAEAVNWLIRARTEEYRLAQIRDWRERYGDEFAEKVAAGLERESKRGKAR